MEINYKEEGLYIYLCEEGLSQDVQKKLSNFDSSLRETLTKLALCASLLNAVAQHRDLEVQESEDEDYAYAGPIFLNDPCVEPLQNELNLLAEENSKGFPSTLCWAIQRVTGYSIYPGEKDSFGWLTGCCETPYGIVVFG